MEKVTVEIELENDILFKLMLLAHEKDITLNQLVAQILEVFLAKPEN